MINCIKSLFVVLLGVASLASAAGSPQHKSQNLRVFQFNIWQEGTSVKGGFEMIVDAIIASKADVVTMSEVRNYHGKDLHQRLVAALKRKGHQFYAGEVAGDVGLLSRFPVKKTDVVVDFTKQDRGSLLAYTLLLPSQREVIVCSAHLDYRNYAIYLPRGYDPHTFKLIDENGDGKPDVVTDVKILHAVDQGSMRDEAVAAFIKFAKNHADADIVLAGDFNECSHLDWTVETKNLYGHNGVMIAWKNSLALKRAGFTDAYRLLFPDPVSHPGATWPSDATGRGKSTSWTPLADERDRIDFIYSNQKNLKPTRAFIAGTKSYYIYNRLTASTSQDPQLLTDIPWPSDHKGLIVDFELNSNGP